MSNLGGVLADLDTNLQYISGKQSDKGETTTTETILDILNKLENGQTYYFKDLKLPTQLLHLELCWWQFRGCISKHMSNSLRSVARNGGNIALISCTPDLLRHIAGSETWIKFKLTRLATKEKLHMASKSMLSMDKRFLTVFVHSVDVLLEDINAQRELLLHDKYPDASQGMGLVGSVMAHNTTLYYGTTIASGTPIKTYELQLTKPEVTYLIGKAGARVQSIREVSNTIIKILPIASKLSPQVLTRPELIAQMVTITGDLYGAALAMATIQAHIALHHTSPRNEF